MTKFLYNKKLFIHVPLSLLSLYTMLGIDSDIFPLIPSIFSNRATVWINITLLIIAALYIIIAPLFLFKGLKSMKKSMAIVVSLFLIIYIPVLFVIILIPLYEFTCIKILSRDVSLSEFSTLFAGITGLLAFWGVLYSLYISEQRATKVEKESKNRFNEESERNIFFQLLNLHTNKVLAIIYEDNGKHLEGIEAFKKYVEIADKYFFIYYIVKYVEKKYSDISLLQMKEICNTKGVEFKLLKFVCEVYTGSTLYGEERDYELAFIRFRKLMDNRLRYDERILSKELHKRDAFRFIDKEILQLYLDDFPDTFRVTCIERVSDYIYKEYGHITGHYFRNMFYVMRAIKSFSNNEKYVGLFRAQLSRYELALGLFNAVSTNSSKEMIDLLKEFKVFKDIYPDDITIIKILFENDEQQGETRQKKMLRITNSLLDDWRSTN